MVVSWETPRFVRDFLATQVWLPEGTRVFHLLTFLISNSFKTADWAALPKKIWKSESQIKSPYPRNLTYPAINLVFICLHLVSPFYHGNGNQATNELVNHSWIRCFELFELVSKYYHQHGPRIFRSKLSSSSRVLSNFASETPKNHKDMSLWTNRCPKTLQIIREMRYHFISIK
jgi:hypothetical protein